MVNPFSSKGIPLPKSWPNHIKEAIHTISLAHATIVYSRGWAADSRVARVRLAGDLDAARNEISLLEEEIRIKNARMGRLVLAANPLGRPFRHFHRSFPEARPLRPAEIHHSQ